MFDKIGFLIGYIKLIMYKICYGKRLKFHWKVRFMPSSKIRIGKHGKICLGNNFRSRYNCLLKVGEEGEIYIDENVFINDNSTIVSRECVKIGRDTVIASGVMIYDHNHVYGKGTKVANSGFLTDRIIIGDNVWIGLNSVLLKGVSIGNNSVIAAGTVVKKDIEGNELVYDKKNQIKKELN